MTQARVAAAMDVLLVRGARQSRNAVADALTAQGYTVLEAVSTDEALGYLTSRSCIRVLVTDVEATGCVSGLDLARFVSIRMPNIALIVAGWPLGPVPSFRRQVIFVAGSDPTTLVQHVRRVVMAPAEPP